MKIVVTGTRGIPTDYAAAYRQYCMYGRDRTLKQFCSDEDFNYSFCMESARKEISATNFSTISWNVSIICFANTSVHAGRILILWGEVDGKLLIYCHVPESTQAHSYKNVYYDRNRDGDFELRSTEQIANLFIRKSKRKTEETVYPALGIDALDEEAFAFMRQMVRGDNTYGSWCTR